MWYTTARKRHNNLQKRHVPAQNQPNYRTIFLNWNVTRVQVPLKFIFRPILGLKYMFRQEKKLGAQVLNLPFLKGDLEGLSGSYLIPAAPFWQRGRFLTGTRAW
jgi:hypothetical protein